MGNWILVPLRDVDMNGVVGENTEKTLWLNLAQCRMINFRSDEVVRIAIDIAMYEARGRKAVDAIGAWLQSQHIPE